MGIIVLIIFTNSFIRKYKDKRSKIGPAAIKITIMVGDNGGKDKEVKKL